LASATAHSGAVTAVTPLRHDRADVAASAGVDGVVRVLSLDGGSGGGVALVGHLAPVTGLVRVGGFSGMEEFETVSLFFIFVWAISMTSCFVHRVRTVPIPRLGTGAG